MNVQDSHDLPKMIVFLVQDSTGTSKNCTLNENISSGTPLVASWAFVQKMPVNLEVEQQWLISTT